MVSRWLGNKEDVVILKVFIESVSTVIKYTYHLLIIFR